MTDQKQSGISICNDGLMSGPTSRLMYIYGCVWSVGAQREHSGPLLHLLSTRILSLLLNYIHLLHIAEKLIRCFIFLSELYFCIIVAVLFVSYFQVHVSFKSSAEGEKLGPLLHRLEHYLITKQSDCHINGSDIN